MRKLAFFVCFFVCFVCFLVGVDGFLWWGQWKKLNKWVTHCHFAMFAAEDLLETWGELLREKVTTGSKTALWTFIAPHQEFPGTGCSRLILMVDCKSWWTPLSKLWTDLCILGLHGRWDVTKPPWNTVGNVHSLPFFLLEWPWPFVNSN